MAVTFSWVEFNGDSGSVVALGGGQTLLTNLNFGSVDQAHIEPTTYPISAGSNSYGKYICGQWSGSFTEITNIKFWKSAGDYVTGESCQFTGSIAYGTPSDSDYGDPDVQTSQPTVPNVAIPHFPPNGPGGGLSGPTSGSRTAFMRIQALTTSESPAGATNTKTFSLTYDRQ